MVTRSSHGQWQQQQNQMFLFLAGVVVVTMSFAAIMAWVCAMVAGWVHCGQLPRLGLQTALEVAFSREFWSGDPAAAYPHDVARLLPGGWGFWSTAVLLLVLIAAVVVAAGREIQRRMGHAVADRRWYHVFLGRRPQAFGRYRSVKPLIVDGPAPERVIVGTIATPPALLAVEDEVQICAIAAPRSGKTSGLVTPALLEHKGPVVATSTKTDVALATHARREQLGETFVWNPFGERSHNWDPLQGCEAWAHALLVARWLGQAMALSQARSMEYFDEMAQELLAPLLHAAAVTEDLTVVDVYRWVRECDVKTPTEILTAVDAQDALLRLDSVYRLNARQRDGVVGTAQVQLKAYGHPAAARTAGRGYGISPQRLFDGAANTLYLVAGREHQQLLAPLVVTMLSSLLFYASEEENRTGQPMTPQALIALDETAQIAPLRDLPQILSVSLSAGIRFLTVWHSLAQMRERYGADAAATILALSQAKVFLGSITDKHTRDELVDLLGQRPEQHDGRTQYRDALVAPALQRLRDGQGLLVHGELPPVFFQQRRYFEDKALRQLASCGRSEGTAQATAIRRPGAPRRRVPVTAVQASGQRSERASEAAQPDVALDQA